MEIKEYLNDPEVSGLEKRNIGVAGDMLWFEWFLDKPEKSLKGMDIFARGIEKSFKDSTVDDAWVAIKVELKEGGYIK